MCAADCCCQRRTIKIKFRSFMQMQRFTFDNCMRINHFGVFLKTLCWEWRHGPFSHRLCIGTTQIRISWLIASHTRHPLARYLRHFHAKHGFAFPTFQLELISDESTYIIHFCTSFSTCEFLYPLRACWWCNEIFRLYFCWGTCTLNHHKRYLSLAWCMGKWLARNMWRWV